jgi:hypothetical protein
MSLEHFEPKRAAGKWAWPVRLNEEYLVFSMERNDGGIWFATFEHHEQEIPVSAPLALFDVLEPTVSRSWNVRVKGESVSVQPVELDDPYFCDDVQERRGDSLERYRAMKIRLGKE